MTDEEIVERLAHIERTLAMRWWVFSMIAVGMILIGVGIFYNLSVANRNLEITLLADARSQKNEAAIDSVIKQQLRYQVELSQYMDFLYRNNPRVKVPKVIVRPPVSSLTPSDPPLPDITPYKPLTESDITRNSSKSPTPIKPTSSSHKSKRKPKPTPTPTRFVWPWQKPR